MKLFLSLILLLTLNVSNAQDLKEKESNPANKNEILTISEKNSVVLNMPILGDVASDVSKELLEKSDKLDAGEPMYLILDTPGGSVDDGEKIIEVAKSLPRPVHTVTLYGASMGFIISQKLGTRYVVESSTLMAHRATVGGLQGTIPGTLNSKLSGILNQINRINKSVAERAGITLEKYSEKIRDELWMNSEEAIENKFADQVVTLRCDQTLRGLGEERVINLFFFSVKVRFNKCPLVKEMKASKGNEIGAIEMLKSKKEDLVQKYGFIFN